MCDGGNQQGGDHSGGVFAVFGWMAGVGHREPPGIRKHKDRFWETDAVVGEIFSSLVGVPLFPQETLTG